MVICYGLLSFSSPRSSKHGSSLLTSNNASGRRKLHPVFFCTKCAFMSRICNYPDVYDSLLRSISADSMFSWSRSKKQDCTLHELFFTIQCWRSISLFIIRSSSILSFGRIECNQVDNVVYISDIPEGVYKWCFTRERNKTIICVFTHPISSGFSAFLLRNEMYNSLVFNL